MTINDTLEGDHRTGLDRSGRQPLEGERVRQRHEPARGELHGGHRRRVAPLEQARLEHDQDGGARHRGEHEQVAGDARARSAGTRHEAHARERERVAAPLGAASVGNESTLNSINVDEKKSFRNEAFP